MNRSLPPDCAKAYRVEELIGEGAYGEVYRAVQIGLERVVALKVLRAARSDEPEDVQRFRSEAKITSALSHPGIVIVIEWGHAAGLPWIAYEYLPGPSLMTLGESRELGPARVAMAGVQIAQALQHAHESGVLHRDVKPENVVEVERDRYKVGDFGIAKWSGAGEVRTRTGMVIGSPMYLAPELIAGEAASPRSDVYALGISLYQLLAGRPPFDGSNVMEVLEGHVRGRVQPLSEAAPEVGTGFVRVVERAMARKPDQRYASAAELAEALEPWQAATSAGGVQTAALERSAFASGVSRKAGASGAFRTAAQPAGGTAARSAAFRAGSSGTSEVLVRPAAPSRKPLVAAACAVALAVAGAALWGARSRVPPPPPHEVREEQRREVATPSPTSPELVVHEVDLLSDTTSVCVYLRYRSRADALLKLLDDKGQTKGQVVLPAGSRTVRRVIEHLATGRRYRVIIEPGTNAGPGLDLDVKTQTDAALGGYAPEVIAREGGTEAVDSMTQDILRDYAKSTHGSETLTTWWRIGNIFGHVLHLAEIERRLLSARSAIRLIETTRHFDVEDIQAIVSYLRLEHDPEVLAAIDDQVLKTDPSLRVHLAGACVALDSSHAAAIAEETFKRTDQDATFNRQSGLIAITRQQRVGADSVHAMARQIEAVTNASTQELSEALIDLDPAAARRQFLGWSRARPDLVPLAIAGLAELGGEADVAELERLMTSAPIWAFQRALALRRLTDLATPAARAAIARAVAATPGDPLTLLCAGRLGLPEGQAPATRALATGDVRARLNAAVALGDLGSPAAVPALTAALADPVREVRRNAAWALGQIAAGPAPQQLRSWALSDDDETGVGAWALGRLGDVESGAALLARFEALRHSPVTSPPWTRAAVIGRGLRLMKFGPAEPVLDLLSSKPATDLLRLCAARALPGAQPGSTVIAQFPFIGEQRTGLRLLPGQVVVARTTGSYAYGGDMRPSQEFVFVPAPHHGAIKSSIRVGFRARPLRRSPRELVAAHAQEVVLSTLPAFDIEDHSQTAGGAPRGLALVELTVLPLPGKN